MFQRFVILRRFATAAHTQSSKAINFVCSNPQVKDQATGAARKMRLGVIGLSNDQDRPSHKVARRMQEFGYEVVPINPHAKGSRILGAHVHERLSDVNGPLDVCVVFRSPEECVEVAKEAVEAKDKLGLKVLWMQSGIVNEDAATIAKEGGLECVMDMCVSEVVAEKQGKQHDREGQSVRSSGGKNQARADKQQRKDSSSERMFSRNSSASEYHSELPEGLGESHGTSRKHNDSNKPFDVPVHGRGATERSREGSHHENKKQYDVSAPYGSVSRGDLREQRESQGSDAVSRDAMGRPYQGTQDYSDEVPDVPRHGSQQQSGREFQQQVGESSQASPPDDKWKFQDAKDQYLKHDSRAHDAWQKGNYAYGSESNSAGSQSVYGKPQTNRDVNKKHAVPSENKGIQSSTSPLTPGAPVTPLSGDQHRRAFHTGVAFFTQHTATTSSGAPKKVGEAHAKEQPFNVADPDLKQPRGAFAKSFDDAEATRSGEKRSGLDTPGDDAYPAQAGQQFDSTVSPGDRHYTDKKGPGASHNVHSQRRHDDDPPYSESSDSVEGATPEAPRGLGARSGSGMFHEARNTEENERAHRAEQSMRRAHSDESEPTGASPEGDFGSSQQESHAKHHHRVGRRDVDDYGISKGSFQQDKQSQDTLHQGP